ncbi:insecticidal toxin [Pseudomonas fluorescens]|uniref:TcdA/TcdB pore-forming domain-containing protein n=1 Tax=Pseudomonas fluorescens TaxID=294 RepID=UPI00209F4E9B|nr:TcdA/TcdB pore-forming domain-containing protein [Pseudomonas fluorescens]MCP1489944.1 insecticidal toxin [Pseudomonas fluorescens]
MPNSYQSLLESAQATFKEMRRTKKVLALVDEIKKNYRDNGKKWTSEALGKQRLLEDRLEKDAYLRYSNDKPADAIGLNETEQREFVAYVKALAARAVNVDLLVQDNEKTPFSSQTDSVLNNAEAFRVLPKDFAQRHSARAKVGARLTVNVDKAHFNELTYALTQLFSDDNRSWLHHAKIIGPKKLGTLTDQAVIYLSSAGVEHAQAIRRTLVELLPANAFIEHTPSGMYRVGKGVAYSETAEGESSSHGQSRAKLIAAAGAQALLTDTPIERTLPRLLQTRGYDVREPALLAQAVLDRNLKGSLVPMSGGAEPREGSGDIQQFMTDPVQFAQSHVISAEALAKAGRLPAEGAAQLVNVTPGVYELEYTDRPGSGTSVPAYFLGYNGSNQANASPAYVDIAKHAPAGSFLFTGSLSGCSLIVTTLDTNTYRVYHDGRVNSSLLYDNVVMAVDFKDYQVSGTAEGLAAAYLQYINGEWQLAFQKQEYQGKGMSLRPKQRSGEEPITIQTADSQVMEKNQTEFAAYREQVHQQLKRVATQFGLTVEGVADGVYTGGEFSPGHPAISAWTTLRDQIYAKISIDTGQLVIKRDQLSEARRNSPQTALIDQQINQVNLTLKFYEAQYDPLMREVRSVEKTWLWQQIKAKNGMAIAVRTDDTSIQGGDDAPTSTLGERYAISEAYQRGTRNAAFFEGLRNFQEITIPGVNDTTSVLEMKRLFLEGSLNPVQRGALSGRITETSQAQYIDKVLAQTAVFSEDFQGAGSTFSRLVPQDFYLSLVGDKSGGRCYPLVRAMAVALASSGEEGVNSLVEKLFLAAADPEAGSSTLLKNSLITLHSNVDAVQASTVLGLFNLHDVVSRLAATTQTTTLALNTQRHSMMVGSIIGAEGRRYYFYDPNVGIFAFNSINNLSKAMTQHLVTRRLASFYGAQGSATAPIFDLVEIDAAKMAAVPLNRRLSVADLSRPGELVDVLETQHQMERTIDAQERVVADALLRASLVTFDAEQWGAKYHEASTRLAQEAGLDYRWMPVIANTQKQADGRYEVQFINREQPEETRWLTTKDTTFVEFRDFVDEHTSTVGEHFTLENGEMRPRAGAAEASPVDGLNSGFAVQALIRWFTDKGRQDVANGTASPELALALKVHSYLNIAQMIHGGIQDVTKVIALVRTALRGEAVAAETSLKDFASSLGHTVNEGAGVVFGGAFVVLDAYELAHAENEGQKAIYGTQLAFDSASFVSSAAGIGAGLLGASTAGAVLGGAGVILGGLAVGFTGLAQAFAPVAEDIKAVGRYFDAVDAAYKGNGYRYDDKQQVLVPLPGAVIKTLNLRQNQIEFDSQYLYRTRHGKTGSGKINYFFWGGDFPTLVRDRSQAIEVRSGIGYGSQHGLSHGDSKAVILPGTVKSYISYGYIHFPGATTRHDPGFDVIRRLEDYRFDYDFYIFPSEYTVSRIHQEYVATPIEVVLDQRSRHLLVPELPKALHGYLHYEIKGGGGEYLVALNEGATVKLTNVSANAPSRWVIDSNQLANDRITVSKNRLMVGGVVVDCDMSAGSRVVVISQKGEVREVDFTRLTTQVVGEDVSKWKAPGLPIEQYLRELAQNHQLSGQYVVVENYNHGARNVGRGFYDVAKDRMLFTDTTQAQAQQGNLGAVIGDHAYFYDAENAAVWRVMIANGQIDAQFDPWFSQSAGRISRLWQEGDAIHLVRSHLLKDGSEAELGYRISGDQMELVSAMGDDALLRFSARTGQHGDEVKDLLKGYESNSKPRTTTTYVLRSPMIKPVNAPLVTVFGNDKAGVAHRYWIRTRDGMVIKPNLETPKDHTLRFQAHEQTRSAWPIPADLMLAGSLPRANAKEVFFFYSKEHNVLFRQEGAGQTVLDASHPSALRIAAPPLASVVDVNGNLITITEDGRVAQLDALGRLNYEAVNEHWLKGRTTWWNDLESVNGKGATLAVFGVKGTDGKSVLPVWYHNGQVVIASTALQNKSLQFLGFEADGSAARLFEPQSGKLFLQPAMAPDALAAAFGVDQVLKSSDQCPVARELMPELYLREAEHVDTGLRLTTVKGEVLLRADNGDLQLIAVTKLWQKSNLNNLPQALAKVASRWKTKGVLTLQGSLAQGSIVQGWFDVASGQVFWSHGIHGSNYLRFLGVAPEENVAYVYNPTGQILYRIQNNGSVMLGRFTNAERFGTSLLLQGAGVSKDDLTAPIIAGVDQVILHGDGAKDTYRLSKAMWRHYSTVVIDNEDPGQALDRLILAAGNPDLILVSRYDDDLLLTDSETKTVLVVRRVFNRPYAAHRHLQIELEGTPMAVSVDQLVKVFTTVGSQKNVLFALSWAIKPPIPTS